MDAREVVQRRLSANGLAGPPRADPVDVVRSLLALQSQDVQPSAWSVAQRLAHGTETEVEASRSRGELLRTHVLRPTWHDVCAQDLRWLLRLTGPRVVQATARARRELGLDDDVLATARAVLDRALAERPLRRAEVAQALTAAGLTLDTRALSHLMLRLELDAMVCSGPRKGREQTWALLDERVPPTPERDRETAVAELVRRFLAGHGPATVQDLAWWSSLRGGELRTALADLGSAVRCDRVDGLDLWSQSDAPPPAAWPGVQLVQAYDEHLVAFPRSRRLSDPHGHALRPRPFLAVVLQDGTVVGSWSRTVGTRGVAVRVCAVAPVDPDGLERAAQAYGAFLGLPARVVAA